MAEVTRATATGFSSLSSKRLPSFNSNGSSTKHIYDGVFASPPQNKLKSSEFYSFSDDEYAEIFGSSKVDNGAWQSSCSSIPILELPVSEQRGRGSSAGGVDYCGIFGDGGEENFGVPDGVELLDQLKKKAKTSSVSMPRSEEHTKVATGSHISSQYQDGQASTNGFCRSFDSVKHLEQKNDDMPVSVAKGSTHGAHVHTIPESTFSLHDVNPSQRTQTGTTPVVKTDSEHEVDIYLAKKGKHYRHTSSDLDVTQEKSEHDTGFLKMSSCSELSSTAASHATHQPTNVTTGATRVVRAFSGSNYSLHGVGSPQKIQISRTSVTIIDKEKSGHDTGFQKAHGLSESKSAVASHSSHQPSTVDEPSKVVENVAEVESDVKDDIRLEALSEFGADKRKSKDDMVTQLASGSSGLNSVSSSCNTFRASGVERPMKVVKGDVEIATAFYVEKKQGRHYRMASLDFGDNRQAPEGETRLQRKSRSGGSYSFDASHDPLAARVKVQPSKVVPSSSLPQFFPVESRCKISETSNCRSSKNFMCRAGEGSLPSLEEQLDINSVAAVSAAALQRAIQEAEMRIRLAKEFLERESQGSGKLSFKDTLKTKPTEEKNHANEINEVRWKKILEDCKQENNVMQTCSRSARECASETARGIPVHDDKNFPKHEEPKQGENVRALDSIEVGDKHDGGGEWEATKHLNQLITGVKNRIASFMSWQVETEKKEEPKEVETYRKLLQQPEEGEQKFKEIENNQNTSTCSVETELGEDKIRLIQEASVLEENESARRNHVEPEKPVDKVNLIPDTEGPTSTNFLFFTFNSERLCNRPHPGVERKIAQESGDLGVENTKEELVDEAKNELIQDKGKEGGQEGSDNIYVSQDYGLSSSNGESDEIEEELYTMAGHKRSEFTHEDYKKLNEEHGDGKSELVQEGEDSGMNEENGSDGSINEGHGIDGNLYEGRGNDANTNEGRGNDGSIDEGRGNDGSIDEGRGNDYSMNEEHGNHGSMGEKHGNYGCMNEECDNDCSMNEELGNDSIVNEEHGNESNLNKECDIESSVEEEHGNDSSVEEEHGNDRVLSHEEDYDRRVNEEYRDDRNRLSHEEGNDRVVNEECGGDRSKFTEEEFRKLTQDHGGELIYNSLGPENITGNVDNDGKWDVNRAVKEIADQKAEANLEEKNLGGIGERLEATGERYICQEYERDQGLISHTEEVYGIMNGWEDERLNKHSERTAKEMADQASCTTADDECRQTENIDLSQADKSCRTCGSNPGVEEEASLDVDDEIVLEITDYSSDPEMDTETVALTDAESEKELTSSSSDSKLKIESPVFAQKENEWIQEERVLESASTESTVEINGIEYRDGTKGALPCENFVSHECDTILDFEKKDIDGKSLGSESENILENQTKHLHKSGVTLNVRETVSVSEQEVEKCRVDALHRRRRWFENGEKVGAAERPSILEGDGRNLEIDQEILEESDVTGSVEIHAVKLDSETTDVPTAGGTDTVSKQEDSQVNVETTPKRRRWFVKRGEEGVPEPPSLFEGIKVTLEVPSEDVNDSLPRKIPDGSVDNLNTESGDTLNVAEADVLSVEKRKQDVEAVPRRKRWFESGEKIGPVHQLRTSEDARMTVDINQEEKVTGDAEKCDKEGGTPTLEGKDDIHHKVEPVNEPHRDLDAVKRRKKEKEKERIAVERAIREARERAFAEARERAKRPAAERPNMETCQRAGSGAHDRLGKGSAEDSSSSDKFSMEAKLRVERAAVERATAEVRERALQKALSEKASQKSREHAARHTTERSSPLDPKRYNSSSYSRCSDSSSNDEKLDGADGESAQRRKAKSERQKRTMDRAAKALEEKNQRDLLAQKEQATRHMFADALDVEVKRWSSGKEGNLRALLSTLQYILGPESGWQAVSLTDLVAPTAVRKAYKKANLCVHPDKLQQRGATIQQKYICEKVFDLLKDAWSKFNPDER